MRKACLALVLTWIMTPVCGPVFAQSDFLKQGQDLLKGLTGSDTDNALSTADISEGLFQALKVGSERVVGQVGRKDGYNADPAIHIPLPGALQKVQSALGAVGLSAMADDLELRLNRGAEAAAPEAREVFFRSIEALTWEDAKAIYDGPDDAATRYFERTMNPELVERFTPIVNDALSEVGAIRSYDQMIAQYKSLPLVPDVKSDLSAYTVDRALAGLFHYLAQEEAAIRNNPAARSTALLEKVFGSQ